MTHDRGENSVMDGRKYEEHDEIDSENPASSYAAPGRGSVWTYRRLRMNSSCSRTVIMSAVCFRSNADGTHLCRFIDHFSRALEHLYLSGCDSPHLFARTGTPEISGVSRFIRTSIACVPVRMIQVADNSHDRRPETP